MSYLPKGKLSTELKRNRTTVVMGPVAVSSTSGGNAVATRVGNGIVEDM